MDDFSDKVNALLSDPKSMEKIMSLAGMLSGGGAPEGDSASEGAPGPEGAASPGFDPGSGVGSDLGIDPAMLSRIVRALGAIKKNDPRIDLLLALRENLSEPRRKKVDEAVQILRLLSLVPMLREEGFLNGILGFGNGP